MTNKKKEELRAAIVAAKNWNEDVKCEENWYSEDSEQLQSDDHYQIAPSTEYGWPAVFYSYVMGITMSDAYDELNKLWAENGTGTRPKIAYTTQIDEDRTLVIKKWETYL